MAAKKKSAAKASAAPRHKRKHKAEDAAPELPSVPLPETRDASRPPRS